jgi:hypothetical protein
MKVGLEEKKKRANTYHRSMQPLRVLDVDGLDIGVKTFLCTFLVITATGDAHSQAERNALNAALPDLLVQLRV